MVQPILMEKIEHVTNIFGAAAIAQWICLHLPSCNPGSNPKHTICAFNNELCYKKTTKINNKQINRIKKYCWQVCYTNAVNGSTCLCSRELCNSSNRNFSPEIVCGICFVQFVVSAIYRTINSTWYHACLDHLLNGAENTKFREPSPLAKVSLVSIFSSLDSISWLYNKNNKFSYLVISFLVKQETNFSVIIPPTVSVLCSITLLSVKYTAQLC